MKVCGRDATPPKCTSISFVITHCRANNVWHMQVGMHSGWGVNRI